MHPDNVKSMIQQGMSTNYVHVEGDGTHFEAIIVSDEFEGKLPVERHKIVYSALGDAMKEQIHALSMKTFTPSQWENINKR